MESQNKKSVGRPKTPYAAKILYMKGIPEEIIDTCRSLVDAEVLKWKLKNKY